MENNKPLETDADDTQEFENIFEDGSEAGDKDVDGEDGSNEETATETFITKDELKEIVGRDIKDKDDFIKHYKNLKGFVGKKVEDIKPEEVNVENSTENKTENSIVMEKLDKIEFLGNNPEAKEYFDELVKPMANGQGLSLEEAYEKVKPYIDASVSQEKEKNIGVESKNRIEPAKEKKLQALANKARQGDARAQEEYVKQSVLRKAGFSED